MLTVMGFLVDWFPDIAIFGVCSDSRFAHVISFTALTRALPGGFGERSGSTFHFSYFYACTKIAGFYAKQLTTSRQKKICEKTTR